MTWKYWDEKTNDWSYLEQGMNFDLDSDSLSHSTNEISFEIRKKEFIDSYNSRILKKSSIESLMNDL